EPGVKLAFAAYSPGRNNLSPVVVISPEGKSPAVLEKWANQGHDALGLELRGYGETTPDGKSPFGPDDDEAFMGFHLNRSLLGQRVQDVLAVTGSKENVHLAASGGAVPVALHAAALEARISEVTLEGGLLSWSLVVKTPVTRNQLANVVPGALAL